MKRARYFRSQNLYHGSLLHAVPVPLPVAGKRTARPFLAELTGLSLQPFLSDCLQPLSWFALGSQRGVPYMHFLISLSKRTKRCFLLRDVDARLYSGWCRSERAHV